ncbi:MULTISPECIES: diaminobutyrate--2-oxoglutarate transaminase [unclassified Sphingomonas]|uniref:diaminobutyrate--2-oxoglutarate transaminase n=1 Tax=unclassified Sphingomonas TaxID=196159 RepID=UPI0010F4B4F6|nr:MULTISPECIES: diaminobutyrate--2-oxoglutarate transaminase [unclassified Sphingomonas]
MSRRARAETADSGTASFARLESEVRVYCRDFPAVFARARGAELFDEEDRRYLDLLAGAGVLNYGHNPPEIVAAISDYLAEGGIVHALDLHTVAKRRFLDAFERHILVPRGLDYKIQFTGPTGTNAIEAALKIARRVTGRHSVIAFTNGYHGVSLGALATTGNAAKRRAAGIPLGSVDRLPFDGYFGGEIDTAAYLAHMLADPGSGIDPPAAILLEVVQAEGGINVASDAWLRSIAEIARAHDTLLIVDDIQAGCGRTGSFFSFEKSGVRPDIVCLSKAIGGMGLPMSLVLMAPEHDCWRPGEHNGTFRGHNLAFVAATAAIENHWRDERLERRIATSAAQLDARLRALPGHGRPGGFELRGRGMIRGLAWRDPYVAGRVSAAAYARGLIVETCGPHGEVLKLLPPLTIAAAQIDEAADLLGEAIADALPVRASALATA